MSSDGRIPRRELSVWFDCSEERSVDGTGPWALVQPGQNCTVCCISTALYLHTCCLLSMESKEEIYEIYTHRETGGGHLIDPISCMYFCTQIILLSILTPREIPFLTISSEHKKPAHKIFHVNSSCCAYYRFSWLLRYTYTYTHT